MFKIVLKRAAWSIPLSSRFCSLILNANLWELLPRDAEPLKNFEQGCGIVGLESGQAWADGERRTVRFHVLEEGRLTGGYDNSANETQCIS